MIIAKITSPHVAERLVQLEQGLHSIGSDFDCDVVLIDDGIAGRHIEIGVTEDGVFVRSDADAIAELCDRNGERTLMLEGEAYEWQTVHSVELGDLTITLRGEELTAPPPPPSHLAVLGNKTAHMFGQSVRSVFLAVGAFVVIGVIGAYLIDNTAGSVRANYTSNTQQNRATFAHDINAIRQWFVTQKLPLHSLEETPSGYHAVLYLDTTQERDRLDYLLENLDANITAKVYLKNALRSAANIVLRNTKSAATVETIEQGRLTLAGLEDDEKARKDLAAMIQRDIPGIQEVAFSKGLTTPSEEIKSQISGVWAGPRPYVIMKSGALIRVGQSVNSDAVLNQVNLDGSVVLLVKGKRQEIQVK